VHDLHFQFYVLLFTEANDFKYNAIIFLALVGFNSTTELNFPIQLQKPVVNIYVDIKQKFPW